MSAPCEAPVFANFEQSSEVDPEEVFALQSLVRRSAITRVLDKGRKIWLLDEQPFTQGFCVMHAGDRAAFDEYNDVYAGVRLEERGSREGRMALSFMTTQQSAASRVRATRNLYQFRWTADEARGRARISKAKTGVVGEEVDVVMLSESTVMTDSSEGASLAEFRPIHDGDISHIGHRLMDAIAAAPARRITPRSVLYRVDYFQDILELCPGGYSKLAA